MRRSSSRQAAVWKASEPLLPDPVAPPIPPELPFTPDPPDIPETPFPDPDGQPRMTLRGEHRVIARILEAVGQKGLLS